MLHPVWLRSGLGQASGARSGSGDLIPDSSNSAGEGLLIKSLCDPDKLCLSAALAWRSTAAEKAERLFTAAPLILCLWRPDGAGLRCDSSN